MPYLLSLDIYNSAGELVRRLYRGAAQFAPTELRTEGGEVLAYGLNPLVLALEGALEGIGNGPVSLLAWDGSNDAGQPVDGGLYRLSAELRDSFGSVQTLNLAVQVLPAAPRQRLRIYNSAGEQVAELALPAQPGLRLLKVPDSVALESPAGPGSKLSIVLQGPAGELAVEWDGRNSRGEPVSQGAYLLELSVESPGAGVRREHKLVQVLRGPHLDGLEAAAAPQPWRGGPLRLRFQPKPGLLRLDLFNLAGERVRTQAGAADTGVLDVPDPAGLAGGVYLAVLEWTAPGQAPRRQVLKLALAP